MRDTCRLCLGFIAISFVGICMGLPIQSGDVIDKAPVCKLGATGNDSCSLSMLAATNSSNNESTDVSIQSLHGFAINSNKSHQLRLSLESLKPIDSTEVRRLLASNKSLDEIQSRIRVRDGAAFRRGNMRLDDNIYQLVDITASYPGNNSVLNMSLAGPIAGPGPRSASNSTMAIAGHITLTISGVRGEEVAGGTLVMNSTDYSGTYQVLLDHRTRGRGPGAGIHGVGR